MATDPQDIVDLIDDYVAGRLPSGTEEYTIAGRNIRTYSLPDLMAARAVYSRQASKAAALARGAGGIGFRKLRHVHEQEST